LKQYKYWLEEEKNQGMLGKWLCDNCLRAKQIIWQSWSNNNVRWKHETAYTSKWFDKLAIWILLSMEAYRVTFRDEVPHEEGWETKMKIQA
jgi:hypothetical protein